MATQKFDAEAYRKLTAAREEAIKTLLEQRAAEVARFEKLVAENQTMHVTALTKIDGELKEWNYEVPASTGRKGQGDNKGVSMSQDILSLLSTGPQPMAAIIKAVHAARQGRGADPVEDSSIRSSVYNMEPKKVTQAGDGTYRISSGFRPTVIPQPEPQQQPATA